ncbi:MAG: response regulator transcription factor, partial [Alphaproteobacteria bacterium]|nr:response regulator transcription factor [Alphaproteobacteria bacterium]
GIEMVFVDPMLSGMDWKIGIEELLRQSGSAKVVVTSSNPRFDDFYYALSRARGRVFACLPKKEQSKSTFSILKMILSGSSYYPPSVGSRTMISGVTFSDKPAASSKPLTVRQSEVLSFLGRGLSNKQIAHEMSVSEATVKLHINALLRNLSATNRTMAVITAQQHGLL